MGRATHAAAHDELYKTGKHTWKTIRTLILDGQILQFLNIKGNNNNNNHNNNNISILQIANHLLSTLKVDAQTYTIYYT